jgi:hypothetical protein
MAQSATATVTAWVLETKARMIAVRNASVQELVEIAQTPQAEGGRMHVDTGFLRASCLAFIGTSLPAATVKPTSGAARYTFNAGQIGLVIAGAELDDVITIVWTANYARVREFLGDRFVGLAVQQWQQIVARNCIAARARVK